MSLFRRRCACPDINDIFIQLLIHSILNPASFDPTYVPTMLVFVGWVKRSGPIKTIVKSVFIHLTYGHMLNSWYGRSCQGPSVVFSLSNAFPGSGQSLLSYLVGVMSRFFCLLSDKHSSDYAERRYRRKCKI